MATTMESIASFWAWWATARPRLEVAIEEHGLPTIGDEITSHVQAMHPRLAWEIGRGRRARHAFCVTSEGGALRPLAERWFRAAPPADEGWEFHPARPADPDALDATLEIAGRRLQPREARLLVTVDERRGLVDVGVFHPAFRKLPDEGRNMVTFLVLDWLLGEDGVERWVGQVDVLLKGPRDAVPAEALPEIVNALAERHHEPAWAVAEGATRDGEPFVAVFRERLRRVEWPLFDLHGVLTIPLDGVDGALSSEELEWVQDGLHAVLGDEAVEVARMTFPYLRRREVHLYCAGDGPCQRLAADWQATMRRRHPGIAITWEPDPAWEAVSDFR
jgi:hypothetical protein